MDPIWESPYKISRVGGKNNYTLATIKRQKDRKTMERLQSEEVPCVTSRYIKARRLKQLNGHYQGQKHNDRGNRLLHQISRSRAHDDHGSDGHRALHIKEYHLPIWHPLIHCHRQRPTIRGQRFCEDLPKIWHQAAHVYAKISSRQ
ncbi:hypothetical protein ACFX14_004116 [Malus domestica]